MFDSDFPSLWRSSDAASVACQKRFLFMVRAHLSLLAATGLLAAWVPACPLYESIVSWMLAVTMLLALAVNFAIKLLKVDDAWFRTRAFAENAKGAAWRFMMRPTIGANDECDLAKQVFLDELDQVRRRFPQAVKEIAKHPMPGPEITEAMECVRKRSLKERAGIYHADRLQDQVSWYTRKAKFNFDAESKWFWIILGAEIVAVFLAFVRISLVRDYNPTGGLAAIAACCVAWLQTKRFSDLANTYSVASIDLKMIQERLGQVTVEEDLSKLVDDAENAISREHRLWVARRVD